MTDRPDLTGLPAEPTMRWLRAALPGEDLDGPWQVELISGGLSNLTYRIRWGSGRYILRRPPLGPLLPRAHDVQREHRILTALASTAVPVPETLAFCGDSAVMGAPFYVMREVDGIVLRTPEDTKALAVEQRTSLSQALIDTLADLHGIDPDEIGLAEYGRHGGYAARQVRTWGQQWQRSRTREIPDMDALITALADAPPPEGETSIVHGDFRFDNTIINLTEPLRIAAVLDWELSTLGDPIADLATALTYWHDTGDHERDRIAVVAGVTAMDGFPTTTELAERYADRTGRDLATLPFHLALAAMKLGVILEGVHARYQAGTSTGDGYQHAGTAVPVLAARGLRTLRDASL
jgi:aminoglycoside phosphotransferase (APT) family kinase protein